MGKMRKKVTGKWVIVRRIHRGLNGGAIGKMEEHKYEALIKEFELLKRGTYKSIMMTDLKQFEEKEELTAKDISDLQSDPNTIIMDLKTKDK